METQKMSSHMGELDSPEYIIKSLSAFAVYRAIPKSLRCSPRSWL